MHWQRAKPNQRCPICGSTSGSGFKGGCSWTNGHKPGTTYVVCLRVPDGSLKESTIAAFGKPSYHHLISDSGVRVLTNAEEMQKPSAPITTRHAAYEKLLTGWLTIFHQHYLEQRQISKEMISRTRYTTLSAFSDNRDAIAERISKDTKLLGVPGFWSYEDQWKLEGPGGILLPVRNNEGLISGCQINTDPAIVNACRYTMRGRPVPDGIQKQAKYVWLTSTPTSAITRTGLPYIKRKNGVAATAKLHYPVRKLGFQPTVNFDNLEDFFGQSTNYLIVEGILKSDIVADRWLGTERIVGMPGASACHQELIGLSLSANSLLFAFDGDWRTNKIFCTAIESLLTALKKAGTLDNCQFLSWNPAHKGLDDLLLTGNVDIKYMPAAQWLEGNRD